MSLEIKKRKVQVSFLQDNEDDDDMNLTNNECSNSESKQFGYASIHSDVLTENLTTELDKKKFSLNLLKPLIEHQVI